MVTGVDSRLGSTAPGRGQRRLALRRRLPSPALCVAVAGRLEEAWLVAEGDIGVCAWAPRSPRLAYVCGGDLAVYMVDGPHETLLAGLVADSKRNLAFDPTGTWLAALTHDACFVLPVGPAGGSGHRLALPAALSPWDVQWCRGGSTLAIAGRDAGRPGLCLIDVASAAARFAATDCELLSVHRDGRVMARRPDRDSGEDEAGWLGEDGDFAPLFRVPEGFFVAAYLSDPDCFLVAATAEDEGDATVLALVPAAGPPGAPWLESFPGLADWAFSPGGSRMAAVDAETDELLVVDVGSETPLRMATPAARRCLDEDDETVTEYWGPLPADDG